ncbi:MAG: hypothetical protein IH940_09320 [Acidobacteria bacterium]|nr:hypothetical protein [Acidobacteriota bacterium]
MNADLTDLTRRAAFASHRLIGWIYWDPIGMKNYEALGVPDGLGYYVATRAAPLASAGNSTVTAAFFSIDHTFISTALDLCREHTTFEAAAHARDEAVKAGLSQYTPEICSPLARMANDLWDVADGLPVSGRPLYAAHRDWPRPADPLLAAWLAINCIREWRGDTHWAMLLAEELDATMCGVLDGAWRAYEGDWLARSRGSDDSALSDAYASLAERGLASGHTVNAAGVAYRQDLEDRIDRIAQTPWRLLGEERAEALLKVIEPVGGRLMERIDETAGPQWMPAGRSRPD